jgi:hypothetical protein
VFVISPPIRSDGEQRVSPTTHRDHPFAHRIT